MTREKIHTTFKSIAIAATIAIGIACDLFGIHMLYKKTPLFKIGTVEYPAAPVLLIIGVILIVVALSTFSKSNPGPNPKGSWFSRYWPILLGIVFFGVFLRLHYNATGKAGDYKYDILVDLILIMLGLVAAASYGIYKLIERELKKELDKEKQLIRDSQALASARIRRYHGYVFWTLFDVQQPPSLECFIMAINETRGALKDAQELPTDKYKREIHLCMNNLIYFLAETHRVDGFDLPEDEKNEALNLARELLAEASKENYPQLFYEFQETCCWAFFHLSAEDDASKEKARDIIRELLEDPDIPQRWRDMKRTQWEENLVGQQITI